MIPAFLTTIFFSLSAIFATRSARLLGAATANLARLFMALLMLGLWAHLFGQGLRGASFPWFFLSGFIGYGLGDVALFEAFTRIGPRLTMLLVHCLAVPIATVMENLWLGTKLHPLEIACICVILSGVCIALTPVRHLNIKRGIFWSGTFFGIFASLGQAGGAVISRKAYQIATLSGLHIDGGTAAYQRMLGGILVAGAFTLIIRFKSGNGEAVPGRGPHSRKLAWLFVALNAITGPALGVACFQLALAISPSGIVLPVVATTPVVAIPLIWMIDHDRPSLRSIVGGIIAVAGTVALARVASQG
jgi:drug/metabolite transporter (DMT)-like permease